MNSVYILTTIMNIDSMGTDFTNAMAEIGVQGFCPVFLNKEEAEAFQAEVGIGTIIQLSGNVEFNNQVI